MPKTKCDELIEAWAKSYDEFGAYRRACVEFIGDKIVRGFADYLGRQECVDLFNLKEGYDWRKQTSSWRKAVSLEDDTFWHFGVVLKLKTGNVKIFSKFHFALKKQEKNFLIRLVNWEDSPKKLNEFSVHPDNNADVKNFHHGLFNLIKDDMGNAFSNFLEKKGKSKTIGFHAFEDKEENDKK